MSQIDYKPIPALSTDVIQRFWANVDKQGPFECWHWTGQLTNGYGTMHIDGEMYYAIRILHVIMTGEDPGEMVVRHRCDKKSCCQFLHHTLGTHQENMQDALERKRFASGLRNGTHTHPESRPRGEDIQSSKLTQADVVRIRERYAAGESCLAISKDSPVNTNAIQSIVRGKRWKHVGGPIEKTTLYRRGEKAGRSILTAAQVIEILEKRNAGVSIPALCGEYGVTQGAITAIIYGKSWKNLTRPADAPIQIPKARLSADVVREIRKEYADGASLSQLAKKYGIAKSSAGNIIARVTWKDVK